MAVGGHPMPIKKQRLYRLFHDLIQTYSPSGKEEAAIELLVSFLKKHGIAYRLQAVEDERQNLLILPGKERAKLLFLGHIDTVAAPDWENAAWQRRGDRIEGLGTADMKAGCAAFLEAWLSLFEEGYQDLPIALAFVVGEEEDGIGTSRLLEKHHFPRAIVAEPTNLRPCLSHYGYVEARIRANGKRVHASVASLGISPVAELLRFLLILIEHIKQRNDGVVYNYRDLSSAPSGFAVPEWCEAWIDLHLPPDCPPAPLIYDIEELLDRQRQLRPELEAELSIQTIAEGYALPARGSLYQLLQACYQDCGLDFSTEPFRSHSDAALLWHSGIKTVVLGPGRLEEAHRSGEGVSWSEVCQAASLYRQLMLRSRELD
jgi:acetylornithine deacetylase